MRTFKKYRSNWKKGVLPDVCKSCNRYQPINKYIKNKASICNNSFEKIKKKVVSLSMYHNDHV